MVELTQTIQYFATLRVPEPTHCMHLLWDHLLHAFKNILSFRNTQ
jgi:hypothetical protein